MTWTLPPETREEWIRRTKAEIYGWQSLKRTVDAKLEEMERILESLEEAK